jgi:4,5-DOPA dioxygenase extradiol
MLDRLPALFVSHGAPTMAIEDTPSRHFLEALGKSIARPRAVVAVSSHWGCVEPAIGAAAHPPTLHDFHGFPEELYEIDYPAPGAPELAANIQTLLQDRGIQARLDNRRGLDHAAWTPLRLMYPDAGIPIVPLAVLPREDGAFHYRLGQALAPLRDEGVLLLASGGATHSLMDYMVRGPLAPVEPWALAFADWLEEKASARQDEALMTWQSAPHAARNHPTPEHFLPFLVALGAATPGKPAKAIHRAFGYGVLAMDAYQFE